MRITKLNIYGFGKFHDTVIDLSEDFQLLYGPNEAGKSTLVAFITSMLFGFETAKHRYAMYLPKDGAGYGGELTFSHQNHQYWLKRIAGTKGGQVIFRDLTNDVALAQSDLEQLLSPMNKTLFRQIFCFGERELTAIFSLNRFDLTRRIQRMGAVGSDSWIDLTQKLSSDAASIYKPRGRVQPLAKLLQEHERLNDKVITARADYAHYQELLDKQQLTEVKKRDNLDQIEAAEKQVEQFQHVLAVWPTYQQLTNDKPLSAATVISTADWQEMTQLVAQKQQLQQRLMPLSAVKTAMGSKKLKFYQQHQQTIDQLASRFSEVTAIDQQSQVLQAQLTETRRQSETLIQRYGELDHVLPMSERVRHELENELQEQQALKTKFNALDEQRQQHQGRFKTLQQEHPQTRSGGVSLKWISAGVIVLFISLFGLEGIFRTLGGIIGLLVAGYGVFSSMLHPNPQTDIDSQLALLSEQLDQERVQLQELSESAERFKRTLVEMGDQFGLNRFPQGDWLSIQSVADQYRLIQNRENDMTGKIEVLNRQVRAYLSDWQFAEEIVGFSGDQIQRLTQIDHYLAEQRDATQRLGIETAQQERIRKEQAQVQTQLSETEKQITSLLEKTQQPSVAKFNQVYETTQENQLKEERLNVIRRQLSDEELHLLQSKDSSSLEQQQQLARQHLANLKLQQTSLLTEQSQQQYRLSRLIASDHYATLLQQQADLEATINQLTDQWLSKQLLIRWIDQTLNQASQGRQPEIESRATELFAGLTDSRYRQVNFTDETVQVVRDDALTFDVGELSSGTAEQLYVALRLAFAQVMADRIQLPLIIDDAFVNFDRGRTKRGLTLLKQMSATTQVLYFTANQDNVSLVQTDDVKLLPGVLAK